MESAMDNDFSEKMRTLDESEQLLAACNVRGVVADLRSHMEINRLLLEEARRQLKDAAA
jgi:hypothetical protein